jgi:hypothetical protein
MGMHPRRMAYADERRRIDHEQYAEAARRSKTVTVGLMEDRLAAALAGNEQALPQEGFIP